ncbi:MAG: phosphoadenylyl-sulfate reductase [Bacteroidetes bacterium QH_7_62_13]|nr:MAG: phosphoadenylyl-sulfate reductase [Bacteroidetes bacterium QH_7_62_13]
MAPTPDAFAPWTHTRLAALNAQFEPRSPKVVLDWAADTFGDDLVQGTGFGPSGIVIMHMLADLQPGTTVFYLDTDLLFPETYELKDELAETVDVDVTRVHGGLSLEEQAQQEGEELWNQNPDRCCHLRKVKPLKNFLEDKRAWITGLRRDQSPSRADAPILKWEPQCSVLKINPLAPWTRKQVWRYLFDHDLPYNPKHDQGYPSLGCVPCTEPVDDADGYSRDGRWSDSDKTECGLHTS